MYVLHDIDHPELYGGLPKDPHVPWMVRIWKGPLKWLGNLAMAAGHRRRGDALHPLRAQEGGGRRRRKESRNECRDDRLFDTSDAATLSATRFASA